ncbi:ImmA/IrrE family metallo-endopeptidase [Amycolatopsis sp., V23-08]|uniref:ImmA/IrrE family metallo-endopeptidase n=1 Tax=Amycolatopsis heterodermiae TaxID=3110235 RepID=A0ABU5QWJ9_9PSEU|nr:ImmA/IrrE family metallo-endopeptidase [Amycolatopsis sp., V23-08]MEA5358292.1 ImmA/IrrE family metallo-endopeptidase [Amycolatopsis sp., V23-08]
MVAADRLLNDLALAGDEPVDVFGAIAQLGLELAIVPLDNLLGAMLPRDGGILVTSNRTSRLQRYTAAHEIGHWVLHRAKPAIDTEIEILRTTTEQELQAQLFAAYFLMPPPLVEAVLNRYELRGRRITPECLYLASRDMHVSYEAAAFRFRAAKVISDADFADLTAVSRLDALRRLFGRRPVDGNADLWHRGYSPHPEQIEISEHDEVLVELPENRSSGWRWLDDEGLRNRSGRTRRPRPVPPQASTGTETPVLALDRPPISSSVEPADAESTRMVDDTYFPVAVPAQSRALVAARRLRVTTPAPTDIAIGGTGSRSVVLRGDKPGRTTLRWHYAHAYDPTAEPALVYQISVEVQPNPTAAYRAGRITGDHLDERRDGDPEDEAAYSVVLR